MFYYLRRRLASGEGIVTLGVTLCVCVRFISLSGEGNALYPVLFSLIWSDIALPFHHHPYLTLPLRRVARLPSAEVISV